MGDRSWLIAKIGRVLGPLVSVLVLVLPLS